ncbi:MAG TPA: hypothetical protein DG414_10960 [Gammaproteobacteria bacterium]|jgi:cell division septation protein DedD|nr:SPOR domain-containing protein [Arenicellales bacterium]HCY14350.1 hypothetical protein [Gammaproteobacteria bacterium]|tara:strand:+ start:1196 stop:1771 length:576 start_codon:yes stop_codon:yes gene_type:complete
MTPPPDPPFNPTHRLVGALVLIVIVIVVLPTILTGTGQRIDRSRSVPGQLPEPSSDFISVIAPATSRSGADNNGGLQGDKASTDQAESDSTSRDLQSQGSQTTSSISEAAKERQESWVVRVGVFSNVGNADKLMQQLGEHGMEVHREQIELSGKDAIRLYLGPFLSQSEAERERHKAMMITSDQAFIVRLP